MEQNNVLQLKKLATKLTGKTEIPGDTIADVLDFINSNYSAGSGTGGGGKTITNFILYPNEEEIIKNGELVFNDGTSIFLELLDPDELTLKSVAGSSVNMTSLTASPTLTTGNTYRIDVVNGSVTRPAKYEYLTDWTEWDGRSEIEAAKGSTVIVAECTADGRLLKYGLVKSNASLV